MEILKAVNITKIYNPSTELATLALDKVSITISENDFICVMGPSGSGKTTLIHNLSTIDKPNEGFVSLFDEMIMFMPEKDIARYRNRYFGFIFQELNLLESLTIYENISLPLLISKNYKGASGKKEITEKTEAIMKKLGIEECAGKYPSQCSGGQKQRAAIARALIKSPKLIVADEPTGNLDSKNSREFLELLRDLNENEGVSILLVTHDASIASYSKKLLYIKDGKIVVTLEKGDMPQSEYFQKIIDLNLQETII
ncbi:MAG: ABC transporter ATP-binding protein [Erysipelotrichaceae bacterium]|nr:ABC transporter ATP-binding protein [Erysipelotrichaceae bacterium]